MPEGIRQGDWADRRQALTSLFLPAELSETPRFTGSLSFHAC